MHTGGRRTFDPVQAPARDDTEDVELLEDPFDDDLSDRLTASAPRVVPNRWTYALGAVALLVGGFLAGAQVEKHYGAPASASPGVNASAAVPGFAGRFGGGQNGTGQNGPNTTARSNAVTGTVKLVDGTTVYIETPDGQVLTVRTTDSTAVSVPGKLADLTAGVTVSVEGQNAGGTVTATQISRTK
jgi:hypothetical protein